MIRLSVFEFGTDADSFTWALISATFACAKAFRLFFASIVKS